VAYFARGGDLKCTGGTDEAIADYTEALRLNPNFVDAYVNRGLAWSSEGEDDKAIADLTQAIRLSPTSAYAYCARGSGFRKKGDIDSAIADYTEAIRLDPNFARAYNVRAWIAASCQDAKYRNGKNAVADATKACELTAWKIGAWIDTLAAAYAEAGDFPSAVKWEEKAIELAPEKSKGDLRSRLDLFKARKPYHEEVKK